MLRRYISNSSQDTIKIGQQIGANLKGGEVIELISDLGGGKTTFTSGITEGFGSMTPASSPSFTITNIYERRDGKRINHFDFYRLSEPGIMSAELSELLNLPDEIVIVEWADKVSSLLPKKRLAFQISVVNENSRTIDINCSPELEYCFEGEKV